MTGLYIENWTSNFAPEQVMRKMQDAGVPAGVVKYGKDLLEDPQLEHRHYFWMLNHHEMGVYANDGLPFLLSETPSELHMPAPRLDEHTEHVYTKILGMTDKEFVGLLTEGVFE